VGDESMTGESFKKFIEASNQFVILGKRVLYRPHRGGLAESMAESRVFDTVKEMEEFIVKQMKEVPGCEDFTVDDIFYRGPIGDDDRIGWKNVMYIMVRTKPDSSPWVWGMCGQ
jgi:hypothetical protein